MAGSEALRTNKQYAKGRVVRVEHNQAWIETLREGGCHSCGAQKTCGTSALAQLFSPKTPLLKTPNTLNAKEGQQVLLSLNDSDFIKHSIMAYGVPLISLFVFAGLAQVVFSAVKGADLWVALAGLVGLVFGWWLIHRWYRPVMPKLEKIL